MNGPPCGGKSQGLEGLASPGTGEKEERFSAIRFGDVDNPSVYRKAKSTAEWSGQFNKPDLHHLSGSSSPSGKKGEKGKGEGQITEAMVGAVRQTR